MKNKILLAISFLAVMLVTSSCLKDDVGIDWTDDLAGKMYAEFPTNGLNTYVVQPVAEDQIFKALVNIATDAAPTSDISVTFAIDETAMGVYNADEDASFRLYPGAEILDQPLVIKAGDKNAYVHVRLPRADTLNMNNQYMVPMTITNVTGGVVIAANKKTALYQTPVANKWEGTYKARGYVIREGDPVLSGYRKNITVKFATAGATTVEWTSTHIWGDGAGGIGGIGNWLITINESVVPNTITLVDPTNAAVKLLTTYPNRYEPSERTFYISAYWGSGPTNRAETDTIVYSGPY